VSEGEYVWEPCPNMLHNAQMALLLPARHTLRGRACAFFAVVFTGLISCMGQDTTFYDATAGKVNSLSECDKYVVNGLDPVAPERVLTISRARDGRVQWEQRTVAGGTSDFVPDGIGRHYYADGSLRWEREYAHGDDVRIASYWEGGQPRRLDIFENDSLISGKCFKKDGSPDKYYPFETQPEFPKGIEAMYKYLKKGLRYPKEAFAKRITGKIYVGFTVDKDGSITECEVIRSADPLLDAEALRVVNGMPRWVPGKIDDEPVKCRYNLPVVFKF
jgi:TonB family protein